MPIVVLIPGGSGSSGQPRGYSERGTLTNANSLTISGAIDIGATAQLIVVAIGNSGGGTVTSVTVGGTSLSAVSNAGVGVAIYAGVVALSGSQTVTAVVSTGTFNQKGLILWRLNGLSSITVENIATGTTTNTISVNASDMMFSVYFASGGNGGTYSASTQAAAASYDIDGSTPGVGAADWTIVASNASFTVNPTVAGNADQTLTATWT